MNCACCNGANLQLNFELSEILQLIAKWLEFTALPRFLAGFKGPTSKGRERKGKGRKGRERRGEERRGGNIAFHTYF